MRIARLLALGLLLATPALADGLSVSRKGQYQCTGTGCVSRSMASVLDDIVSVKSFGCVCDGVTDDTTCFTNARNAAIAAGKILMVPFGPDCVTTTPGLGTVQGGSVYIGDVNAAHGGVLHVFQRIFPTPPFPGDPTKYPLGADLWLGGRGSADLHLDNWSANLTSTTTVGAPGSATITVGSTASVCPSTATGDPNCEAFPGGTGNLCQPAGLCFLVIEPDGANEETITNANWSAPSATTITATFAKTHTQPYLVRQVGGIYLNTRALVINALDVDDRPIKMATRGGNVAWIPNNTTGTWPLNAWSWNAFQTGQNGSNKDLLYRNNTANSNVIWQNAAGTGQLAILSESGGGAYFKLGNATNSPLWLDGAGTDLARIRCGGTGPGCMFYSSQGGTGTSGTVFFRNNSTDNTDIFKITTGGLGNDTAGLKHKRSVAGCTTAAAIGATCSTTFSWTTAFADANYTVSCMGAGVGAGSPILQAWTAKAAASVTVQTMALTAVAAQFANIECQAVHD